MPRISRILCPVDFSEASEHAVEQAAALAGWYKARLTALHVYSPILIPVPEWPVREDRVNGSEFQRVRDRTTTFAHAAVTAGTDVDVVVEAGHPAAQILEWAARLPADLIVMGTHGASGFEHFVLGSVTEKVLRKAACAVLTVPPRAHATSTLPFKRVLCAVDFSESSAAALDLASSFAQESGAGLILLHVVEWPWREPPPPDLAELPPEQASALAEYRRYLEKSATARLESLVPVEVRKRCIVEPRVNHGKPYAEILHVAAEDRVDLIVMGVHGRNPIELTMFGSTTNQTVRRATCPVLTLRR